LLAGRRAFVFFRLLSPPLDPVGGGLPAVGPSPAIICSAFFAARANNRFLRDLFRKRLFLRRDTDPSDRRKSVVLMIAFCPAQRFNRPQVFTVTKNDGGGCLFLIWACLELPSFNSVFPRCFEGIFFASGRCLAPPKNPKPKFFFLGVKDLERRLSSSGPYNPPAWLKASPRIGGTETDMAFLPNIDRHRRLLRATRWISGWGFFLRYAVRRRSLVKKRRVLRFAVTNPV